MALPTTISGVIFNATDSQGRNRSYTSSGGNVYHVFKDSTDGFALDIYKATDPTTSFSQIATLNLTGSAVIFGIGTFQDGDNIHIATQVGASNRIWYHVFSMSSDTFTTSNEEVTSAVGTNIQPDKAISIAVETGGDIIIAYQAASDNVMGQKERVDYAYKTGGSWTVDQAVDDGGGVHYYLGGIVRGEANKFHLTYKDDTNSNAEHKSVQDVDGTLSTVETLHTDTIGSDFSVVLPVYYDDAGVERITAGHHDNQNRPRAVEIDDGVPGTAEFIINAVDSLWDNGEFSVFCFAVDQKTVWCLYAEDPTQDLFSDSNNDSAGWTPFGHPEELDGVTINLITSNVYTRNNAVVLAYVYDDAGTIKYNEKFLRIAANSAFADARLPRQNYHVGPFEF